MPVAEAPVTDGGLRNRKVGALAEALRATRGSAREHSPQSETPSEEDYDENVRPRLTGGKRPGRGRRTQERYAGRPTANSTISRNDSGIYIPTDEGESMKSTTQKSSQRVKAESNHRQRRKFRDLVFSHQLSAFDPNNQEAANSPFHGFYNLFWLAVALFVCKISANNWRTHGNPLGPNDIMRTMFSRDGTVIIHMPCHSIN